MVNDGHDATVRHVPDEHLLVLGVSPGAEHPVVVGERKERDTMIVLGQAVDLRSLFEAPHDHVRVFPGLTRGD